MHFKKCYCQMGGGGVQFSYVIIFCVGGGGGGVRF